MLGGGIDSVTSLVFTTGVSSAITVVLTESSAGGEMLDTSGGEASGGGGGATVSTAKDGAVPSATVAPAQMAPIKSTIPRMVAVFAVGRGMRSIQQTNV